MNSLVESLSNRTTTLNGAETYKSSKSALVDFFSRISAMRKADISNVNALFEKALEENALTALKIFFYSRDIRGGQGERKVFRDNLEWLAWNHPKIANHLVSIVPEYGRWDDLFVLFYTQSEATMLKHVKKQFDFDMNSSHPSLLGKWMPSENASSPQTKIMAKKFRKAFGMNPRAYRKALTSLRSKLRVVEQDMSAGRWETINYEHVPGKAMANYAKAFGRHDFERFDSFLHDVKEGNKTIKSATLYPYEIAEKLIYDQGDQRTLELQWENLPDYLKGSDKNALVLADVSGSMHGSPMAISTSLALYFAERTKGPWAGLFMTFESNPHLIQVEGSSVTEKLTNIMGAPWGGSTNLQACFDLILNHAVRNNVSASDMPETLMIISDMEFDKAIGASNWFRQIPEKMPNFELIKDKFHAAGYVMPKIVFWNADAKTQQSPALAHEGNVYLVSGASPSLMGQVLASLTKTPFEFMMEIIGNSRYDAVTLP